MQYRPQAHRLAAGHQAMRRSPVEELRAEICSNGELSFLMEAHDGLSARIAERSGFKGLWGPVCRLPARSAFVMPTKRHEASSSRASNALWIRLSCQCSLTGMAASAVQQSAPSRSQASSGWSGGRLP